MTSQQTGSDARPCHGAFAEHGVLSWCFETLDAPDDLFAQDAVL